MKELYLLTITAKKFFKKVGFDEIKRTLVPSVIQNTTEFKDLCPSSATCMRMIVNYPYLKEGAYLVRDEGN